MSNIHNHCPECKSFEPSPVLLFVKKDRLVKSCPSCGHKWNVARGDDWAHPEQGGAFENLVSDKGYVTTNRGPGNHL